MLMRSPKIPILVIFAMLAVGLVVAVLAGVPINWNLFISTPFWLSAIAVLAVIAIIVKLFFSDD